MASSNVGTSNKKAIPPSIFEDLVHYFKYASCAYSLICPRPNGKHLVLQFSNILTDIQGFVARDTERREIVVSFRGSASFVDFMMDAQVALVPFLSPGVSPPHGTRVHGGFLTAWNSVAIQVIAIVMEQLAIHPGYSIVITGHSLGGSLSALASISLKQKFPKSEIRLYSYGAPRTGNKIFADFVNDQIGSKAFRVVHTNDGVPTIIPTLLGYHHHGIEYWQHTDPASAETTLQCSADGEDPTCSASIPSGASLPLMLSILASSRLPRSVFEGGNRRSSLRPCSPALYFLSDLHVYRSNPP